jgi:hypothetical protein
MYVDHLSWPLVVGALLGKRREEPSRLVYMYCKTHINHVSDTVGQ